MAETTLRIGGLTRFTTGDFPGRLACIVHLQFCPLACPYCHAPHLRPRGAGGLKWGTVLAWLESRRGLLDGVVFSGGEPCAQPGLGAALGETRARGFATGLHSSGVYPDRLAGVLDRLDWVGLDWKAPLTDTRPTTGRRNLGPRFGAALEAVLASGVAHEIRTTYHPALLPPAALRAMAETLAGRGVTRWVIQEFSARGVEDAALVATAATLSPALHDELRAILPGTVRRAAAIAA